MYFPRFLAITGLTAAMLVPATATRSYAAQTTTKSTVAADDSTIQSRVEKAIKAQPTLKDQDIDVKVNDKVVTLSGYVQTPARKASAARAANVPGVARVDNQLMVDADKGKAMDAKVADAAKTTAQKTGDAA